MFEFWMIPAPTQEKQGPTPPTKEPSDWRMVPGIEGPSHPQAIMRYHGRGTNPFDFQPGVPYHTSISRPQGTVLVTLPDQAAIVSKTSDTSNTSQSQNVGGQEVVPYIASIPPEKPDTSNTNQSQNVGGQGCVCDGSE